ncbi:MAG TPA: HAMP domain-containing sensor histidine kinase [Acidimicrobiales bacterium]|nr:HAMP domain-containing sensor histidine kinase [Acidimicrobiales bacterium]
MTLRLRFAIAGGIVLLVVAVTGFFIPQVVAASQLRQVDEQLDAALPQAVGFVLGPQRLGRGVRAGLGRAGKLPDGRVVRSYRDLSTLYVAEVTGGTRRVYAASGGRTVPRLPTRVSLIGKGMPVAETVSSLRGGTRWQAILLKSRSGPTEVVVAVSLAQVDATDGQLRLALLAGGLAVLLAAVAVGWWLVRLGLRPIAEVTAVADAITRGERSRRVGTPRSGTEAGQLAHAFNVMLDEEQSAEERLRRFLADASHELRTPVTAIRGFADLWREGALGERDVADALRRIGQESARMATLVEEMLLLARLDDGRALDRCRVDLADLVRDAALDASVTHPSRDVVSEAAPGVAATGDEARLRQVLSNLVTNALVHTPDGTEVRIRAYRAGASCVVEVADDGEGMDAASAASAFDRFWRGQPGRSGPGSGLGLSIVAGIVAAHHGEVKMTTAPGAGVTVRVSLPAAPDRSDRDRDEGAPRPSPGEAAPAAASTERPRADLAPRMTSSGAAAWTAGPLR